MAAVKGVHVDHAPMSAFSMLQTGHDVTLPAENPSLKKAIL